MRYVHNLSSQTVQVPHRPVLPSDALAMGGSAVCADLASMDHIHKAGPTSAASSAVLTVPACLDLV
jgi:hypothetical protein